MAIEPFDVSSTIVMFTGCGTSLVSILFHVLGMVSHGMERGFHVLECDPAREFSSQF